MEDLDAIYRQLATGSSPDPAPRHHLRRLQSLARDAIHGSTSERMGALRVAAAIGDHGHPIVLELARDGDPAIRRHAFNQALASGWKGLPALRRFVADSEEDLAVASLEILTRAVDTPSLADARRALRDTRPKVRTAAAQ